MGLQKSTYIVVGAWGKWDSKDVYRCYGEKSVILSNPFLLLSQLLIVKNLMRMRLSSKV